MNCHLSRTTGTNGRSFMNGLSQKKTWYNMGLPFSYLYTFFGLVTAPLITLVLFSIQRPLFFPFLFFFLIT